MFMKLILIITLLVTIFSSQATAQNSGIKYYNNCQANKNYYAFKGDTVVFKCDSIRLLNTTAFSTLQNAYSNLYQTTNQLVIKTDSAGIVFKSLYEQKAKDYEALNAQFANFRINTQNHILATDTNILAIKNYTNQAQIQLNKADSNLNNSIEILKKEQKNVWLTKVKYTSIGFLLGILSTITFVLVK